jgi:hypothetical protein
MRQSGWNKTRRNRNIGTSKQGHGKNNQLAIPQPADTLKFFYERFEETVIKTITVHGKEIQVVVEHLKKGYFYSCSPDDVEYLLNQLPQKDLNGLGLLIFRQPKKKEVILSSVWGRLIYSVEFKGEYYPTIMLEATPNRNELTFPKKQSVDDQREFELLKQDGLRFEAKKREFIAEIDEEKIRSIQLYRTLLHEVGHYVQYLEVVEFPGHEEEDFEEWEKRSDFYFSIPVVDKEAYANKYAVEMRLKLINKGIIPFSRLES